MNANELKVLQAPFKDRYRSDPESAQGLLSAEGVVNFQAITVQIRRDHPIPEALGLHPRTGGDGTAGCAAELLLEALVGCAGVTFAAVCTAMEIPIETARLRAEGTIDFRGTLGVSRDVPVGFQKIRLQFFLGSSAPEEKLAKAVQLAERYCVVAQSLIGVHSEWTREEESRCTPVMS